jgi:hypothetical protein
LVRQERVANVEKSPFDRWRVRHARRHEADKAVEHELVNDPKNGPVCHVDLALTTLAHRQNRQCERK